ncbi:MAG: PAS domain-containing protein [Desulfatibacillaceae bacterium]
MSVSPDMLERIPDTCPGGIALATPDDRFAFANPSLLGWLGYAADQLEGTPVLEICPLGYDCDDGDTDRATSRRPCGGWTATSSPRRETCSGPSSGRGRWFSIPEKWPARACW